MNGPPPLPKQVPAFATSNSKVPMQAIVGGAIGLVLLLGIIVLLIGSCSPSSKTNQVAAEGPSKDAGSSNQPASSPAAAGKPASGQTASGQTASGQTESATGELSEATGSLNDSVFDLKIEGDYVIFIVDASESMTFLRRDEAELRILTFIQAAAPEQEFGLVGFNEKLYMEPRLVRFKNTAEDIALARAWFRSLEFSGGTFPELAFSVAAQKSPEDIFVVTDGEFSEESMKKIGQLGLNAKVSGVSLDFASPSLRELCQSSHGHYRYVILDE